MDLLWGQKLYQKLRFVLVEYDGQRSILVSTDLTLTAVQIIELYSRRFCIENCFREMKQQTEAFCYHFWTKALEKLNHFKKKEAPDALQKVTDLKAQRKIIEKVQSIEVFVQISCIAFGILQLLAVQEATDGDLSTLFYTRTKAKSRVSEAKVRWYLGYRINHLLLQNPDSLSAVKQTDAVNWKTPGKCVFHYSDFWKDKYLERFRNPDLEVYVADHEFPDADVTSYIKLLKQCGIVLYGKEIGEVFADVSDEDFWLAISADIDEYDFHAYDSRYLASNVLILGRILSFKIEKRILSKYEGGIWMIKNVPENLKYLPELAMKIWFEGEEHILPGEDLNGLRNYLIGEIKSNKNH